MTKKHFRAIANAVYQVKIGLLENECPEGVFNNLVDQLADVCASGNPRFNRETFINACENGL